MSRVLPQRPGEPGTNHHVLGTGQRQTRVNSPAIVTAEGGGTSTPTLGGGIRVTRARGTLTGAAS
jgi:hypothetical protein